MIRKNKSHDDEDCSQSKKHRSTIESVSVCYDDQSSIISTSDRTIPTQTSHSESNQSSPVRHDRPYLEIEETPPTFQSTASTTITTRSSILSVNNASQSCNLNELGDSNSSSSENKQQQQQQQQPPKSTVVSAWNRLGRSWGWFVSAD